MPEMPPQPPARRSDAWYQARLAPPPRGARLRVVIDTDAANEIDDQFALAWALLSPERLDVLAVYAAVVMTLAAWRFRKAISG